MATHDDNDSPPRRALHPPLIHAPIGGVGTGGLVAAAVAGVVDRARHTAAGSSERGAVNRHAAVMTLMTFTCVVDLLLRLTSYDSVQHTPVVVLVLTPIALALAGAGGELGGRLVYRAGIGIAPRAPRKVWPGDAPAIAGGPIDQRPATTRTG